MNLQPELKAEQQERDDPVSNIAEQICRSIIPNASIDATELLRQSEKLSDSVSTDIPLSRLPREIVEIASKAGSLVAITAQLELEKHPFKILAEVNLGRLYSLAVLTLYHQFRKYGYSSIETFDSLSESFLDQEYEFGLFAPSIKDRWPKSNSAIHALVIMSKGIKRNMLGIEILLTRYPYLSIDDISLPTISQKRRIKKAQFFINAKGSCPKMVFINRWKGITEPNIEEGNEVIKIYIPKKFQAEEELYLRYF